MKPYTVLRLESNAQLRKASRGILELEGYRVLEVATIREGRKLLEKEKPDLLMLDAEMPDGSGFDFCREVRRESTIPILFVTDLTSSAHIREGYEAGCDEYMPKQYLVDVFLVRVRRLLGRPPEECGWRIPPLREYAILLVEDNPRVMDYVNNDLTQRGYRVITCPSPWEAREAMTRESPDLILLDAGLPDGSGLEFCRELKKKERYGAPILFHSFQNDTNGIWDCFCAGGEAALPNPLDYEKLLFEVRNYLP